MILKDLLNQKRNAVLEKEHKQEEEERRRQEEERQRKEAERWLQTEAAVAPHPLRGRNAAMLDEYVRGQLVLRNEGKTLDEAGDLLRLFTISLGISFEHFAELEQEISFYDDQSKGEILEGLSEILKQSDEVVCFMCDMARLHGDEYSLDGEFLELWRSVCIGIFQVGSKEMVFFERLATLIARREMLNDEDEFDNIPKELIQYFLGSLSMEKRRSLLRLRNRQYLIIDLSSGPNASHYPCRSTNDPPNLAEDTCRTTELWLRRIPAGNFTMGSPENELGRNENENQHQVTLTQDYYIGVFPCTQRQYELVTGKNPSNFKQYDRPVEQVSYEDLRGPDKGGKWPANAEVDEKSFFWRLREKTGLAFDLPTESEWEYACRAGTTTALNNGKNITSEIGRCPNLDEVGWYSKNAGGSTHPVGQKQPNAWGLYDMHGNVWEWCLDWYGDYATTDAVDPQGVASGECRVYRGGGWASNARYCRSAARYYCRPSDRYGYVVFRIACILSPQT